ncbi:MAG: hypothetical protein JWO87_3683 [Phycisphaerales bacterium]|nr:hypothetical protein [Phycisphaerales bacterium]
MAKLFAILRVHTSKIHARDTRLVRSPNPTILSLFADFPEQTWRITGTSVRLVPLLRHPLFRCSGWFVAGAVGKFGGGLINAAQ